MNNEKFKKGIEDLKNISMSESERYAVKSNLEFYIETSTPKSVKSVWYSNFSFLYSRTYALAFVLVLMVVSGLNTFSSAKSALPGDNLYSLKVGVIEPLQYAMTVGEVARANLEVQNIDTRLREAEILEIQGRLSDAISLDLQTRISLHSDNFKVLVSNISTTSVAEDNSEVELDLEAKINAHTRIIDSIQSEVSNDGNIMKIRDSIERKVPEGPELDGDESPKIMMFSASSAEEEPASSTISNISSTSNDDFIEDDKFIEKKEDTERLIKSARENLDRIRNSKNINSRILEDAENTVSDAENALKNANNENKSGNRSNAYKSLLNSRKKVKEANTSIEVSQDLPIIKRD